ncbi:MAG: hypothetical protein KA224_06125, partial [Steroidobacteraceae bacterium]|nr:hypothetical protein [Steroidobacteraceae bacterium]
MPNPPETPTTQQDLRLRALARLSPNGDRQDPRMNSSVALGALHDLAMSPDTAGAALKLLHEMQV